MSGPRLIGDSVPRIAGALFARKYIMLGRLVTRWPEIVGADLAARVQPVKIRRSKNRNGVMIAILDIAAAPAEATVLHYRRDLMLERINYIFGEALVGDIRFVPSVANAIAPARRKARSLSPVELKRLDETVGTVTDVDIQKRLRAFGTAILQDANAGI